MTDLKVISQYLIKGKARHASVWIFEPRTRNRIQNFRRTMICSALKLNFPPILRINYAISTFRKIRESVLLK